MKEVNAESPEMRSIELENGKRIVFESYNDAKGGRIIVGNQYLNEDLVQEMENLLNELIDW